MSDLLSVAVMTYNRPAHLRNCLESIARHLPGVPVLVVDDRSDDPAQAEVLREAAAQGGEVLTGNAGEDWHGGLYANMQKALDWCLTPMLLFLQDDTQMIRSPDAGEVAAVLHRLEVGGGGFVSPFFVKAMKRRQWRGRFDPAPDGRFLLPRFTPRKGRHHITYSDINIAHVPALRAAGWRFDASEGANSDQAARLFEGGMALMSDPWAFYCPEVPVFRHRSRSHTLAGRIAARRSGDTVKRFRSMPDDKVAALRARPSDDLPVAEDWLETDDPRVRRPFVYADLRRDPWVWALHKAELALRRLVARFR
jgi:Glycosyltransferases involved in cell wall biogenesis